MQVRVYYEDTDFSGVVYHANYLRFMERGRTNYLRLLGADQHALFAEAQDEAPGFAFVVRSMQIEFLKPARMDDLLDVVTHPVEVKGASILLAQEVLRGDDVLIEAKVRVAFVSGGRARPIPKALRVAMKADQAARLVGALVPVRRITARQHFRNRRRRQHVHRDAFRTWPRVRVARRRPAQQALALHRECVLARQRDECAVRKVVELALVQPLGASVESLGVQHVVHGRCAARSPRPANFSAKSFASSRRHSKQGRWPAASAVGSSRKNSSV